MKNNDFDTYVRQRSKELGLSLTAVAKKSDISRPNLYKLLSGSAENARISTLVRLANALQTHPLILIQQMFEQHKFVAYNKNQASVTNDASGFIRDVTFPDNSAVKVKQHFIKTWEIQNVGNIHWKNRFLSCVDHQLEISSCSSDFSPPATKRCLQPSCNQVAIADLAPGESTQISVDFTAPDIPGSCISYWKMTDHEGKPFFPSIEGLSCLVQVLYI